MDMGIRLDENIIKGKSMQERILWTLEAYLLVNREVMSDGDIKNLEEQIEAVKKYKPLFRFFK
jgi:hypothetical protein